MRRAAESAGTALKIGWGDLLLDRGRSAVSDQDLLCGPNQRIVFKTFGGCFVYVPLCERPDECRAELCGSESVVDGPFDVQILVAQRGIEPGQLSEWNRFKDFLVDVSKILAGGYIR